MEKYFVNHGLYAGETVIIISTKGDYVIAQPIDDHGRDIGETVSLPKKYLQKL
jgi:hypothetical protein